MENINSAPTILPVRFALFVRDSPGCRLTAIGGLLRRKDIVCDSQVLAPIVLNVSCQQHSPGEVLASYPESVITGVNREPGTLRESKGERTGCQPAQIR